MRDYTMPKVGMGDDEEMAIVQWLVAVGETFGEGQNLLEVETSKAAMEVEATEPGILLAIIRRAGELLRAGEVIAIVADPGERVDADQLLARIAERGETPRDQHIVPAQAAAPVKPLDGRSHEPAGEEAAIEPVAATVHPGADGSSADGERPSVTPLGATIFAGSGQLYGLPLRNRLQQRPASASAQPRHHPLSRHRRALARMMTESGAIPQFSVQRELPMAQATRTVAQLRAAGVQATLTDVVLRVTALALRRHPEINSTFLDDTVHEFPLPAIALATDSPAGVVAPVIRGADHLTWPQLAGERRRVVEGARGGHLLPPDLTGGTFAVSNVGALDGDAVTPLIMPPQVAILGLGRVRKGWGQTVATAVLAADHRILDGADAARFLGSLAELFEQVQAGGPVMDVHGHA